MTKIPASQEQDKSKIADVPGDSDATHIKIENRIFAVLAKICELHKLPFSAKQATHGIPLEQGVLTISLLQRAAENLLVKTDFRKENPSKISGLLFPVIIFFKNGDFGVAQNKDSETKSFDVWVCAKDGSEVQKKLSFSEALQDCHNITLLTVPLISNIENTSDLGKQNLNQEAWFWPVVRRFWPNWSFVIIATFMTNCLGLALPLFVMNVYDKVIPNESIPTLWSLAAGVAIALVLDFLLRLIRAKMIDNSGERIDLAVSSDLFERAMDVRMSDRQLNAGQISNQVREFDAVRDFFSSSAITSAIDLAFVFIFLTALWFLVGQLALVPLFAVVLVIIVTLFIQLPLKRAVEKNQAAATNRHSVLVDAMVGIETVKAISAEGILQKRWEKAVAHSASSGVSLRMWSSIAIYFAMLVQQFVSVIVIAWGVFFVIEGTITVGALIASNILAGRILAPLGSTATTLVRMQQSLSAFRNISGLMGLERDNKQTSGIFSQIKSGALDVRNISFSYKSQSENAINGMSFKVNEGEKIGLIGRVGSGKSTIGKLISGLYTQDTGEILLDNTDIRNYPIAEVRSAVAYVSQETELFSGSLRENILLAHPERAEQLETAIKVSGVIAFAGLHPMGLDMNVGERGRGLSGGQRQAVGLARMIISDPRVIYLDEPTSQMDNQTESQMINGFKRWLTPDKTVMIATHRNSLLSLVDRLIVIEAGKVIMDGPKTDVLRKLSEMTPKKRLNVKGNSNAKK